MGRMASILIVDSNPGFALMLKESLEDETHCRATVVPTGSEALEVASAGSFDLAIVDLGIQTQDDLDGEGLVRKLREANPDMSLIVIPLHGDALPDALSDLDVQGTLPKPFFMPDLPDLLHTALGGPFTETAVPVRPKTPPGPEVTESSPVPEEQEVSNQSRPSEQPDVREAPGQDSRPTEPERGRAPERTIVPAREQASSEPPNPQDVHVPQLRGETEAPAPPGHADGSVRGNSAASPVVEAWSPAATAEIGRLAREVNAEAVIVTDRGDVVACVGRIGEDRRDALGQSIWRACQLSGMAARSVGREPSDFEQAAEGEDYILYTLTIEDGVLLSALLRPDPTLGFVRHQARETARRLRAALGFP